MQMTVALVFAAAIVANAIGTVLLKIGTSKMPPISLSLSSIADIASNFYILSGIGLYIFSFPAYSFILQRLNVNVAFPTFTSLSLIAVVLLSSFWLRENLTILQIFGLLLVVGGITLLTLNATK